MVSTRPEIVKNEIHEILNEMEDQIIIAADEPWALIKKNLTNKPRRIIFNYSMEIDHLRNLEKTKGKFKGHVVGLGGGTACDTAKYLAWRWSLPLVLIPSIVSVDAWLCRSIAVREFNIVKYIGRVEPERVIVDLGLIQKAPEELNKAGVSDILSITSALGDWLIARDNFGEKFSKHIFNQAKNIAKRLLSSVEDIRVMNDDAIIAIVNGFVDEVDLCESWSNSRPEEGSEHFLAYCLESITGKHYIHGNLVALNILVVLKLQERIQKAVFDFNELKNFFDNIDLFYSPDKQGIPLHDYRDALQEIQEFTKVQDLAPNLFSLENVFDDDGDYSVDGILNWIYS
ncbi:MAG: iron-containing alcohol dehydrogenase [Promethearchaeota archaeon]